MKPRISILLALLVLGAGMFVYMEAGYLPRQAAQQERYRAEQLDPLTHHLDEVLPYRHLYMGNAGNLTQLFGHLPLQDLAFTFQLYPDELTAVLRFESAATDTAQLHLQRSLIYNSTAAIALIGNLEVIRYQFTDVNYEISRSDIGEQYGAISTLLDPAAWRTSVQEPLRDPDYVQDVWDARFTEVAS
ncbi:DUF4825 domain-containing protein [Paenibacillus sp. 1P07SE]|uniref:DUF4825 domain-containing protein n=1 Tax=Paenibacillus sp. 1P07SE TaxID=3132209 RepID=UPI0039A50C17